MVLNHSTVIFQKEKKKGGTYKKSQVCKTSIVKINRNKYLTFNRCPLGNYGEKKEQNKSDQTALYLFTKFGQGNFKGVTKQCFN